MQRGRNVIGALVLAIGLAGTAGLAPQATMAKSRSAATHHTAAKSDDHGKHSHGKDDKGHGKDDKGGHGKDDGAKHH